jgi:hypothetical protein
MTTSDKTYMTIQFPCHDDMDICLINGIASLLQWHKNQSGTVEGRRAALAFAAAKLPIDL